MQNSNSTAQRANIVIFGEAGVGKSSIINLVAGQSLASTSNSALGCTPEHRPYDVTIDGVKCRLWDTIGLNEGSEGTAPAATAQCSLKELIRTMGGPRGIDLLIFCSRSGSAMKGLQRIYRDIYLGVCKEKVPTALVVTYCEYLEPEMETWWDTKKDILCRLSMQFDAHACITTLELEDELIQSRRLDSQRLLRDLVVKYSKRPRAPLPDTTDRQPDGKATLLDLSLRPQSNPATPLPSLKPKTVVLFGETGVGISSVINLIANTQVARFSPGLQSCTFDAKCYPLHLNDGMVIRLYDTVGLEETEMGINGFFRAIRKAHLLVSELNAAGGINLLLFCMRGARMTAALQRTYRLFYEFLCDKQAPIALVITHLETMENMEDWWTENAKEFRKYGIFATDHACVTAVPAHLEMFAEKRAQSRIALMDLLSRTLNGPTGPYVQETRGWVMRSVFYLRGFLKDGAVQNREGLVNRLERQLSLSRNDAERVADVVVTSHR